MYKFNLLTGEFFDQKKKGEIVGLLERFEEMDNIEKVADLLR